MTCTPNFSRCSMHRFAAALLALVVLFGAQTAVRARAETSAWAMLQDAIDRAENGEVITLSEDITALPEDVRLTIASGKCMTLDLNGHTLNRNQQVYKANNGSVLYVQKDALLVIRSSGEGEGVITGGYHDYGGGIINDGTLIMEDGCVTGNAALHTGGGIANTGTLIILGGSVTGNRSLERGGGVFNQAKAHLTVCGDAVSGNEAPRHPDIANEGTLSIINGQADGSTHEDMPVLKRYMAQMTVLPALGTLLALLLAVLLDDYMSRDRKRIMTIIMALVFGLIVQNFMEYLFAAHRVSNALHVANSVFGYAVRPVILALFLSVVKPGGRYRPAWALVGVNAAVYLTAFFSKLSFYYTVNGNFKAGPLRHTCTLVSAVLFLWLFILTMRQFHPRSKKESWLPILVTALIAGAVVMDFTVIFDEQPLSFLTMAIVIACVFYYVWLHLRFVREHEQALQAEQRIQIMMTQIQPHFLFNTLSAIRTLCAKDPPTAIHVIEQFSIYLRQNLETLDRTNLVPLSRELEHTRIYAEIEMLRFPNIRVDYDIQDADYSIPPLTIQPLVENAIRHGVRIREEGVVALKTYRDGKDHVIVIADNGTGFDARVPQSEGGTHIGLANVKDRVERLCRGSMTIDSRPGEGTAVTLRLPAASDTLR